MQTKIMSIRNPQARRFAAELVAQGQPFAAFHRSVCAIFGRGEDAAFAQEIVRIKGEQRINRPLGLVLLAPDLAHMIDLDTIPAFLRPVFSKAEELVAHFGSLCFFRFRLSAAANQLVPSHLKSHTADGSSLIQAMMPEGYTPLQGLIEEMQKQGVLLPAGSSMNFSGQPEIVNQDEGIAFARQMNIPLFLTDEINVGGVQGSQTILQLDPDGIKLVRDGYLSPALFETLLHCPIDRQGAKAAKYAQLDLNPASLVGLTSRQTRLVILEHLNVQSENKVLDATA